MSGDVKADGLLETAYSIVARHEGHIAVESETGRGATFIIHLPAVAPGPAAERRDPPSPAGMSEPSGVGAQAAAHRETRRRTRAGGSLLRARHRDEYERKHTSADECLHKHPF